LKRHHTHPATQSERGDTPFGSSDRLLAIQKALDGRDNKHSYREYYHRMYFCGAMLTSMLSSRKPFSKTGGVLRSISSFFLSQNGVK